MRSGPLNRLRYSLKYRIAAIIFLLEGLMMAAVLFFSLSYSLDENRKQLRINENVTLNLLGDLSRIALLMGEYDDLQPYMDQVVKDPNIEIVYLADNRGRIVVSSIHSQIGKHVSELKRLHLENREWLSKVIRNKAGKLGQLSIRFSHANLIRTTHGMLNRGILTALIGMSIILVVGIIIGYLLTRRLEVLSLSAQRVAAGQTDVRANMSGKDEIAIVGQAFDGMVESVQEHLEALENARNELEHRVRERTAELAVARDRAIEADSSKSAFLANMSHEIRTPLTAIIGFSESLLENKQSMSERVESISTIIRSSKHLLNIINDILDLSKIEADKLEVETNRVSPLILLRDVRSLIELMAEERGLVFHVNHEFPLPESIEGDAVRLKQVLINLCNNAIKFTPQGSVVVSVSCDPRDETISFVVRDSGIGMTGEQLGRLFQPFAQADTSISRRFGGTGLGLHLSRRLCHKMGGELTVQSTPGEGSVFTATIATGSLDGVEFITRMPQLEPPVSTVSNKVNVPALSGRILLAEDNQDNQRLVSMYIHNTGASVDIAEDGLEAVAMAINGEYDLVLMDMQMPVKDGLAATKELREKGYQGAIIALTANAMQGDVEACLGAGCDSHFSKPINRAAFYAMLAENLCPRDSAENEQRPIVSPLLQEEPDLQDLIEEFVSRLPEQLAQVHSAWQEHDMQTMKLRVHDLKGTGGNFGFPQIYEACQKLEFEIAAGNMFAIEDLLKALEEITRRIEQGVQVQRRHGGRGAA